LRRVGDPLRLPVARLVATSTAGRSSDIDDQQSGYLPRFGEQHLQPTVPLQDGELTVSRCSEQRAFDLGAGGVATGVDHTLSAVPTSAVLGQPALRRRIEGWRRSRAALRSPPDRRSGSHVPRASSDRPAPAVNVSAMCPFDRVVRVPLAGRPRRRLERGGCSPSFASAFVTTIARKPHD